MENSNQHPGVSGKDQKNHSWFNQEKFKEQRDFVKDEGIVNEKVGKAFDATGDESNLFGRTDLSDQPLTETNEDWDHVVLEALSKSPQIDAHDIVVHSSGNIITLEGTVSSMEVKRAVENIVNNLSGVEAVKNNLAIRSSESMV